MALKKRPLHDSLPSFKRTKPFPSSVSQLDRHYHIGAELGRGSFGVTRRCINKHTGASYACKSIAKAKLVSAKNREDVRTEIEILKLVSGHPNIVGLKDVYEDSQHIHIVMELCEGGELFDKIVKRQSYPEREAAFVIKSLVEVVKYCHSMGVIHRDLKPENILLSNASPFSPIKVADFGLALQFVPGQRFRRRVGSAYYMAPEVLYGDYSNEVDLWSVGVILYVLLSGVPPFWGDIEDKVFNAIKECKLDLVSEPWSQISMDAKQLICGLLNSDTTARLSAEQVLTHPWILQHTSQLPDLELKLQPMQTMEEQAEVCRKKVTKETALRNGLQDHIISSQSFPLKDWRFRFLEPVVDGEEKLQTQSPTGSNTKPLDISLMPSKRDTERLLISVPCSVFPCIFCAQLVESSEESEIFPAFPLRDSLDISCTSSVLRLPYPDSSDRWIHFRGEESSVSIYDTSTLQLPLDVKGMMPHGGYTLEASKIGKIEVRNYMDPYDRAKEDSMTTSGLLECGICW